MPQQPPSAQKQNSALEVFRTFLKLGLTSFGGPIAHLAYFRREFVEHRRWVSEQQYAQLLMLCQFLPGPASSQLGFSMGLLRAGFPGALAAFIGFTLPSALFMFAFATYLPALSGNVGLAVIHGLKLVAVAAVAHGVTGMSKQHCTDWSRKIIALLSACIMLTWSMSWLQLVVVTGGALAGVCYCRTSNTLSDVHLPLRYSVRLGWILILLFALLLLGSPLIAQPSHTLLAAIAEFYRAGALVFGGGHVVLPLLKESVVDSGWISANDFLAGYGAAQAVPGPMFTLAVYLGALLPGNSGGAVGATMALLMIFLPGLLLMAGALPVWRLINEKPYATRAIAGINAAVVGLLAAAFYNPVWISGISNLADIVIAMIGFLLLSTWRASAVWMVLWCVGANLVLAGLMHRLV